MEPDSITIDMILSGFLVFVRIAAMVMTAPFFNSKAYPVQVKLFFAITSTVLLFYIIPSSGAYLSASADGVFIVTAIIMEALVGIAMGLVGQLVFAGLDMAGNLISINTSLSFANMVDPQNQQQSSIITNILNMLGIIVFLAVDGDKLYLSALAKSFEVIPVNQAEIHMAGPFMLEIATYLFVVGVQLTSPFILVLFLMDVTLAIFARIMPQANMMFIALPLKFGVGIGVLMLAIQYLPTAFNMIFQQLFEFLADAMVTITPMVN